MDKGINFRIGLDIGISSVGWAVLGHDTDDNPNRIIDMGVRVFDPAEVPKTGDSLAVERREARGNRRRLRRRAFRIEKARKYMSAVLGLENISKEHNLDVYYLRSKGLDERLTEEELYYLIIYFVKHRGFKSNRKSDKSGKDGKLLKAIKDNKEKIKSLGYRTFGELIYKYTPSSPEDPPAYFEISRNGFRQYFVRNHGDYKNCFLRDDLQAELTEILRSQQKLGNEKITDTFIENVIDIFSSQRNFDDGPNEPSPYKANFKVGNCTFEPSQKRAPKGTFTFEYFLALQTLNNLGYYDRFAQKQVLTSTQKEQVLEKLLSKGELKYADVRKILNLDAICKFMGVSYRPKDKETIEECLKRSENKTVCNFAFTKEYAKILNLPIDEANADLFDIIGYILSMRKSDDRRVALLTFTAQNDTLFEDEQVSEDLLSALRKANLTEEQIDKIIALEPKEFGNLSILAMRKIIPYLKQGNTYDKACGLAGYDFNKFSTFKKDKIHWADLTEEGTNELQEITSPVVLRSVSQTIKVINAIIDKYGSPSAIYVELARDMAMNHKERKDYDNKIKIRQEENEKIYNEIKSYGIAEPSGQDILKLKLYREQDGKSAYSLKSFEAVLGSVSAVFDNNSTQIDHIVPYSKCFDDSMNNKVLVLSNENQEKGNRVPKEYLSETDYKNFEAFVLSNAKYSERKKNNLLKESSKIEDINELNNRALNDTKQASKFILNMLENHLNFRKSSLSQKPVRAVNGNITSYLRKIWAIQKIRFENDKHHAVDACVVACANSRTIQNITKFEQYKSIARGEEKNTLLKQGDEYIDKITGERISASEYVEHFKKWEEEYDVHHGKINLATPPYANFVKELQIRAELSANKQSIIKAKEELKLLGYTEDELDSIKPIFISRMPKRKVLGKIHKETIKNAKNYEVSGKLIKSVPLTDLNLKDGEIENYASFAKASDPVLYNALKARLAEFGGKGEDAFKEPFYKPIIQKDGTVVNGNPVKKVKVEEVASDFVRLSKNSNKVADKSSMVRIDIFKSNGKYYIVPVYVSDVYKQVLPNICAPYKYGRVMKDEDFVFSLYPGDLFYMENYNKDFSGKYAKSASENSEKPVSVKSGFFYYVKTNVANGNIYFTNNDRSINFEGIGIQKVDVLEKYVVDILGNYSKVRHESRQDLKFKKKK